MTEEEEETEEDTLQDLEAVPDLSKEGQCTTGEVVVVEENLALVLHPTGVAVRHLIEAAVHHPTEAIVPHLTGAIAPRTSSAIETAAPEAVTDSQ